jgi:metal-dependent HD superfamily phosphatase/phosphodiesterase
MRSPKEISVDKKMLDAVSELAPKGTAFKAAKLLMQDEEIQAVQDYANTVSIKRLGYNDHGPVHMRTVALNAVIMLGLLRKAGIATSLEAEECGVFEDSLTGVIIAASLHDLGMSIGRQDHEIHSLYLSYPIIDRILNELYPDNIKKRVMIRSLALEGISGHMGNRTIHSLEAGVILVADGCDMKKGRARISLAMQGSPSAGDIHKYSANSIEDVIIQAGNEKPVRIEVLMSSEVGLFQVEEVLLGKVAASTAKSYIELFAIVQGNEPKRYM